MILPWLVGPKRAKEIILTGADRIPAAEAARIGLINRVVPSAQLESAALALARHIAVIDSDLSSSASEKRKSESKRGARTQSTGRPPGRTNAEALRASRLVFAGSNTGTGGRLEIS
jgi:enoyl-CoA hydratase/carnithine racemase